MDFKSMTRKELQALCKKHGLAANPTNSQMIASLSSILENEEKNKRKGCLKGSGGSNGEGNSKKVSFVIEDEDENDFEEFRGRPVGKPKRKSIRRRSGVAPELEKSSLESPKNVTGIQQRSTRSRGLAEAVVWSPVIEKRKKNSRESSEGVRENDNPIPTARALRNRVVTVENPRTTQKRKGSDKKEESEKSVALLVEDVAVGWRNLRKRSRDDGLVEDKAAPRKLGRINATLEESVAAEEVDVGRSKKRRKGDTEVLDGGGAAKRSNANTLEFRDVKAQGQGKTWASKQGGDSADITSDYKVVAVATRRSTLSSSAVEKSNEEGEETGKAKSVKQAKGHSVEAVAEPIRRATRSSSALFEDEKLIKGGEPVKSQKQAKGQGGLTTLSADVEVPIRRSTRSSSSLLENGTCIPVVGKPVNRKRGVSTASLADSEVAAEPTRRWARNSSKLLEVDAHSPSAGKLDGGAEAIRNDKRRKQPKAYASKTVESTVILTVNEDVTTLSRRSIHSSSKLSEVESLPEVETLGNDDEVGKRKSGKESKKPASKMGIAILPEGETLTSPARRSTRSSSKVLEDGIVLEAGKLSKENESVTKEKSYKKSIEYALKDGNSSKLVYGSPAVSESIRRSTRSSLELLEGGILVEAKKLGDHNKTVSKKKSGTKLKNSVLKDGDSTKSVAGSPAVTMSVRRSSRSSSKVLEDGNLVEAEKLAEVNEAVHKDKSAKKVEVSTSKDGDSLAFVSGSPVVSESNRRSTRSSLKHNMLETDTPLSVPAKPGDANEAAHEHDKELPRRSTRSASKHDESCISSVLLGKEYKKRTRDAVSKEDEIVREVGSKGTIKASPTSPQRKSPRLCSPHTGSKLFEGIQNDSHMKGKSSLGKKHTDIKLSSHMYEEQDVLGGNEVEASKPLGSIAIAEKTSQSSLEENVSNVDAPMEAERTSESQNITTPLVPLERLEEMPTTIHTKISTVVHFKEPDLALDADIEHEETIHISTPQFPLKSPENVSLTTDLETSPQIDLEGSSLEVEINHEAADAGGSTLVCKSLEQGVSLTSDNDSKLVADDLSDVMAGDAVTADNEATTIIDPVISDTEVCTKTFSDLVVEEPDLKVGTNTAGTPLSSKSTYVEIPAMNKESSPSDGFLIEASDSRNPLEVPLTVDRDAGDLSSIQRIFDNKNADTDTLLRDQFTHGECDAVKLFESPTRGYSQLYEGRPETIKETWVSSSPLVAGNVNIETSDGKNGVEGNEDELRPSSPNDLVVEEPDLKVGTNTAGTPLSSKSTYVEIPAMNKESSPSDGFLIEASDSRNPLEVPLTVDRDAGDLSSIQRIFDNKNADTDTLLRDQFTHGECDAVELFESPTRGYSQLYEGSPETIKETWVSSSPLVAENVNTETSDGKNDVEGNEDELRPSSPNDLVVEEPDLKVGTNTAGTPLSSKSTYVEIPAMNKESSPSDGFLMEASDSRNPLEVPLTVDRDAGDLSSIQRIFDNKNADTDTLLRDQFTHGECDAVELFESPTRGYSQLYEGSPETIKETWVSSSPLVAENVNTETSDGKNDVEGNEDELRPSSPNDLVVEEPDLKVGTNTAGTPLSSKSTYVEIPAMNKESSPSDGFLIEASDSRNPLEVPLTVDRDAGDLSSIQRIFDNKNADTDTLLRDQFTHGECDAVELFESPTRGYSQLYEGSPETIKETWVSSSPLVAENVNTETSDGKNDVEGNEDELRPSSPNDLVVEEPDLKVGTNTAGTPLSCKSTYVEIPAMNKESSPSDGFLIEASDSRNPLEVPLTVDRDAGDLSSIQRIFDNKNADTDTLLRDQFTHGECDAVELFESPTRGYSQLYEGSPETIKETWVSSSPLVAGNVNTETSDGKNDVEGNEDELRPSSPNDQLKEHPPHSSSEDVVAELQSDFTQNLYDKDTADAEENWKDAFMEPDHTSTIQSLDATGKSVNQMEKEDRFSDVDEEYTGFSSFTNDNRSLADTNFLEDKKVVKEVDLPTLPVSFTCHEENLPISSTEAPVSREDATEQANIQNFPIIPDNEDARAATVNVTENLGVNYLDRSPRSAPREHEYVDQLNVIAENLPETARSTNKLTDVEIEGSGEERVLPLGKSPSSTFIGNETATCEKETFVGRSLGLAKSPGTCFTDLSPTSFANSDDGKEIGENVEPRLPLYVPKELDNQNDSLAAAEEFYEEERAQASPIKPASVLETTIIMESRKEQPSTSESIFLMTADTFEFKDDKLNAVDTTGLSEIESESADNGNNDNDVELEEGPNFSNINSSARLAESESREISGNIEELPAEDQPLLISRETLAAAITDSSSKTYFQSEELNVHEGTFESFEQNFNVEETWTAPGPMQFLVEDLFHKDSEVADDIAHFSHQAHDEEKMDHDNYGDFFEINTAEAPAVTKSYAGEDSQDGTNIHVEGSGTVESILEEAMTRTPTAANREEIKYAINGTEVFGTNVTACSPSGTDVTACSPSGINDVNQELIEEDYVQCTAPAENFIFDSVNDDAIRNKESTVDLKTERSSKHNGNENATISNSNRRLLESAHKTTDEH